MIRLLFFSGKKETGAGNAGLNVGRQDWTTGTLALGGRWMGLVGSNIFGREALAKNRVDAEQDLGDRRGETNVSLQGNPGFAQSVRGAKVGTTALQLGAGLSVPVGTKGTIYVNGNADTGWFLRWAPIFLFPFPGIEEIAVLSSKRFLRGALPDRPGQS